MSYRKIKMEVYGSKKWKLLRDRVLSKNPICQCCDAVFAHQVHHIKPFFDTESKKIIEERAFDINNLQSICSRCHKEKTINMMKKRLNITVCPDCGADMRGRECIVCLMTR